MRILLLSLISFCLVGCGGVNPNTEPETLVVSYGADILAGVNQVQKLAINLSTVNPSFVDTGRKITSINEQILEKAKVLDSLVVAYHSAKTLDNKVKVDISLTEINNLVLSLLSLSPDNEYLKAVQNTLSIIFNIRSRV